MVHAGERGPAHSPLPQRARVTLPGVQRRQPVGAEAPAGLLEACLVLHHCHENLQPGGVGLGKGTVGTLPCFRLQPLPPAGPGGR